MRETKVGDVPAGSNPYAPPAGGQDDDRTRGPDGAVAREDFEGLAMLIGAVFLQTLAFRASLWVYTIYTSMLEEWVATALPAISLVGMLAGGLAALWLGPRVTAAVGAAAAVVGHVAFLTPAPPALGAGLVALGVGVTGPCFAAAAVDALAREDGGSQAPGLSQDTQAAAYVVAQGFAVSFASLLGPFVAGVLSGAYEPALHLVLVAPALSALGLAVWSARSRRPAGTPARAVRARPARTARGLAILVAPWLVYAFGAAAWPVWDRNRATIVGGNLAGLAITLGSLAALHRATRRGGRWVLVALYGASLAMVGPGLVIFTFARSEAAFVVAHALRPLGLLVAPAVPTAYAALAARGRATTLAVAGCTIAASLWAAVSPALREAADGGAGLLWACALLTLGAGAALLGLGKRLHRRYFAAPPAKSRTSRRRSRRREIEALLRGE